MDEFNLIRRYFALLATEPAAFGPTDDAALLTTPPNTSLVLTADTIVAGVHFFPDDPPDLVAKKLLRVNLSDLGAKGATPRGYLLSCAYPQGIDEIWIARFTQGLQDDQLLFSFPLLGGDTVATSGPLTLSCTALGLLPGGRMLLRSGARPDDGIYVTGTLGDSALGLRAAQERIEEEFLLSRYHLPQPRIGWGHLLLSAATACMDVSDGLAQDAMHMATASQVAIRIDGALLPLSAAARSWVERDASGWESIVGGGDDYELLFTAPATAHDWLMAQQEKTKVPVTRIGTVSAGEPAVTFHDANGRLWCPQCPGYRHFSS